MTRFRDNENLIGESNSFLEVLDQVSQLAPLNKPVLIIGERGTGKELIAARLHYLSARWDQAYLTLNCAALNENLIESELFGHESGAFTGAQKKHEGRFERAHEGTLFLDELGNTPDLVQEKLLRVIEYGEFERVGGSKPIRVDVRLIAATNEDLPALAQQQAFRADLLDRLAFDVITIPPLRYRREDILLLAEHFAMQMARELQLDCFTGFTEQAKEQLLSYQWPGNVRELKNVIERSLYRLNSSELPLHDIIFDPFASPYRPKQAIKARAGAALGPEQRSNETEPHEETTQATLVSLQEPAVLSSIPSTQATQPIDFKQITQDFEVKVLNQALHHCQFNQRKTAEHLGLTYHQLRGYLKKYHLLDAGGKHD